MSTRSPTATDGSSDADTTRSAQTTDAASAAPSLEGEKTGTAIHAQIIAERNDCKWCGGCLSGEAVERADGTVAAAVDCEDCGRKYV